MVETVHAHHPLPDAAAIEKELVQLWREMGQADKPMVRARVMTLVVATPEDQESAMAEQLVGLAERHPARTLLLLLGDPAGEAAFDAAATLLCGMHQRALCAEQIHLHAVGPARARLPSAVRTLLTANLPTALWWDLAPTADPPLLEQLARQTDHLVLDTAHLPTLGALHKVPWSWLAGQSSDLNWHRLSPWRDLVAGLFDPPAARAWLPKLTEVAITGGGNGVAMRLLAGWLGSRLGWSLTEATAARWQVEQADGGSVTIRFTDAPEAPLLGEVSLRGGEATFTVQCRQGSIEASATLPDQPSRPTLVERHDPPTITLLSRVLDLMARDPLYGEAVAMVRASLKETS